MRVSERGRGWKRTRSNHLVLEGSVLKQVFGLERSELVASDTTSRLLLLVVIFAVVIDIDIAVAVAVAYDASGIR
jgi:hypothetical protein